MPRYDSKDLIRHGAAGDLIAGVGTISASSRWILLATSVIAVIPVWISRYPPMSDLPQHAAQVALLRDLHNPQFPYAGMFHLNWFTPYLFGYLLVYFLSAFIGIVAACKTAVSLFVVGLPLSTGFLIDSIGIDPFWAILTIPCAYGFAYQWGFLNFLIAAPLGICFLAFVIRHRQIFSSVPAVFFAIYAVALFFCHALICAFFGICAVLFILTTAGSIRAATYRILPLTAVIPVALLWLQRTATNPAAMRPGRGDWNWLTTTEPYYQSLSEELHLRSAFWGRLTGFTPNLLGVFPSWWHLAIAVALIALPFLAGLRFNNRFAYRLPLLLCVAVLLWCPETIFGTDFVYQRFTMFAIPMLLVSLAGPFHLTKRTLVVKLAALLIVVGLVNTAVTRAKAFNVETNGFSHALALMEPGQRVLSLAFDHEDGVSIAPTFLHFPSWYAAEKQGLVDPSVAMMHPELVLYRTGATPAAVLWDFEWDPDEFQWSDYSGNQYRYFVVRSQEDHTTSLFSDASCPVQLRFHQEEWWLYERATDCH